MDVYLDKEVSFFRSSIINGSTASYALIISESLKSIILKRLELIPTDAPKSVICCLVSGKFKKMACLTSST